MAQVALALGVGYEVVLGWIHAGKLTARRVWDDWAGNPEQFRYAIRPRAVARALRDDRVLAELWRRRRERLERSTTT